MGVRARERGVRLALVTGGSRLVVRVLELTGLDRVLSVHPDLDRALGAPADDRRTG